MFYFRSSEAICKGGPLRWTVPLRVLHEKPASWQSWMIFRDDVFILYSLVIVIITPGYCMNERRYQREAWKHLKWFTKVVSNMQNSLKKAEVLIKKTYPILTDNTTWGVVSQQRRPQQWVCADKSPHTTSRNNYNPADNDEWTQTPYSSPETKQTHKHLLSTPNIQSWKRLFFLTFTIHITRLKPHGNNN